MFDENKIEHYQQVRLLRVTYPQIDKMTDWISFIHQISRIKGEPERMFVSGRTGTGKTTTCLAYQNLNPQFVTDDGIKTPVLYTRVPPKSTLKNLVSRMLGNIGDPTPRQGSEDEQTERLEEFIIVHKRVELVIIDELQRMRTLKNRRPTVDPDLRDFLVHICDATKVPIILVGLPESNHVLESSAQLSGRFAHKFLLKPFPWSLKNESVNKIFKDWLKDVDEGMQFRHKSGFDDDDLASRIHYATDGYLGYLMPLFRNSAYIAIHENEKNISKKILSKAWQTNVRKDMKSKSFNPFTFKNFDYAACKALDKKRRLKNLAKRL